LQRVEESEMTTCYNTCAFTGCYKRIPYDPKEKIKPSKYCEDHEEYIKERIRRTRR